MHTHSFRCCTLDRQGKHQCMLSKADRDQINHPEDYPGVRWELRRYKDGLKWHRVELNPEIDLDKLFPTVDMKDRIPIIPDPGTCGAYDKAILKQRTRVTIDTIIEQINKKDKQTTVNMPWWTRLQQNLIDAKEKRDQREREELETKRQKDLEAKAIAAWDYLWEHCSTIYWHSYLTFTTVKEEHPILTFIQDRFNCSPMPRKRDVPLHVKTSIYEFYFIGKQIPPRHQHQTGDYLIFVHEFYKDFMQYCAKRYDREVLLSPHSVKPNSVWLSKDSDNVWCVTHKQILRPITLGGIPKQDVIVEPFYRFLPDDTCIITMTDADLRRIRITIDEDYNILGIDHVDNGKALDNVQIPHGHALLDMIKVCVPLSDVL